MPAYTGLTREQLFRQQIMLGMIQEYYSTGSEFQRYYNVGIGSPGKSIVGRSGAYDISNPTRNLANPRSPSLPEPTQVRQKVYGQIPFTTVRFFEGVTLREEDFMSLRPVGGQTGQIDQSGQSFVAQELVQLTDRNRFAREFMATRMMMGGFGIKTVGDVEILVEKGTGDPNTIDIDSRVPSDHMGDGPIDGLGTTPLTDGIFKTKWSSPSVDIIGQFTRLDMYSSRVNGSVVTDIWINGSMYGHLLNITQLREVRGTAMIVFDRYSRRQLQPGEQLPDTGFDVTFLALPGKTFHVYNSGFVGGEVPTDLDSQTSESNFTRFIPDNKAIMTPRPSQRWISTINGSEPQVKKKTTLKSEWITGFDIWSDRSYRPAGQEIVTLDNVMIALKQPKTSYYITVGA